jgi:hypothetical protein
MSSNWRRRFAIAYILSLFVCTRGETRPIPSWPFDKLFKNADLVVVVKALATKDVDDPKPPKDYLVCTVTTFQVLQVVKGEFKDKELRILHFRLKEGRSVANGPSLVKFHTAPMEISGEGWATTASASEYMLFLKREKDESYDFVSGRIDAAFSVKQILGPLP